MTSIFDCIQRGIDSGDVDKARGQAAQGQFNQLVARYETIMPRHQAEASAAADLKEATRKAARSRFHMVVNQLQAMRRLKSAIESAPDPALALRALIVYREDAGYTGESIRSLQMSYEAQIRRDLADVLNVHHKTVTGGVSDEAGFQNVIREAHGEKTGDPVAAQLADAIRKAQRRQLQNFNALGGDIGELADYGVRHTHSAEALQRAGFTRWADDIRGRLAWDRITDVTTGKPFAVAGGQPDRAAADRLLKNVYDGITTRGWNDRTPSLMPGGKALYNQHADHRILHFKDGTSWLDYNKLYGASDPFTAMMHGLNGLARDVAMMRVLGPNPRAGLEFAIQTAEKRVAGGEAKAVDAVGTQGKRARVDLLHLSGAASIPESVGWAQLGRTARAFVSATNLGSAIFSSTGDCATSFLAARMIGLNPANIASRTVQLTFSKATREQAARMGFIGEALAEGAVATMRWQGPMVSLMSKADRLSQITLRASALTHVTDMRRISFEMEFAAHLADNAARAHDALPQGLQDMFRRRGITATDWDHLRHADGRLRSEDGSADFIAPLHWLEHQTTMSHAEAEGLALRTQAMLQEELEMAVPTDTLSTTARIVGETKPGSLSGEMARSGATFKGFGITLFFNQMRRAMMRKTFAGKIGYAASAFALLELTGALTIQLKELAKGNDPRPMNEPKFWLAALLQGGGFGIFGDFFAAEQNRIGGGIGETIAGPVISLAGDVIKPVASNLTALAKGEKTHWGSDLTNLFRNDTPVLSSLWYARAAYQHAVVDQMQWFLDPGAEAAWKRQEQKQLSDFGTRPFWRRGDFMPSRAPDLSNIGDMP